MARRTTWVWILLIGLALAGCTAGTNAKSSNGVAAGRPAPAAPADTGDPVGTAGFAPEVDPAGQPQSTFGMDVDTASYGYTRNLINQGRRPSPQDVRPEEFVNAFQQDYPQPAGNGFAI